MGDLNVATHKLAKNSKLLHKNQEDNDLHVKSEKYLKQRDDYHKDSQKVGEVNN